MMIDAVAEEQALETLAPWALPLAARSSLLEYVYSAFPGEYDAQPHHLLLIDALERAERGEVQNLMVFMPPQRGKSALTSVHFPAWYHGRYPDANVIACSYGLNLARSFSQDVRDQIMSPSWPFPDVRLKPGRTIKTEWGIDGYRGQHVAAGVGGGISGIPADLLLIDDVIKNAEEAESEVYREKVWDWYWKVANARCHGETIRILVMTRWNDDDLAGRLIDLMTEGGQLWEIIELKELCEEGDDDPLGRAPGEVLWPSRHPKESTDVIRRTQPRVWFPLYQQTPGDIKGGMFKREWFSERYDPKVLPDFQMVVQSVDSAFSEDVSADFSVIATWAATRTHLYLLDIWRDRVAYPDLIAAIRDQYDKWKGRGLSPWVYIENKASGISAVQTLQRESRIPAREWKVGTASKESRAQDVTPWCGTGRVLLPKGAPWVADWIEEHAKFPTGKNDDQVDSTVMAIKRLTRAVRLGAVEAADREAAP